jgi:hypothetical protein
MLREIMSEQNKFYQPADMSKIFSLSLGAVIFMKIFEF